MRTIKEMQVELDNIVGYIGRDDYSDVGNIEFMRYVQKMALIMMDMLQMMKNGEMLRD